MICKPVTLVVFALLLVSTGMTNLVADVLVVGAKESKKLPLSEANGLVAAIVACGGAYCSKAQIRQASEPETRRIVDTWHIVAAFKDDFPLEDGDIVSLPEHVIGCMEPKAYNAVLAKYLEAKAKSKTAPADWSETLKSAGSSCGQTSLREAEKRKK